MILQRETSLQKMEILFLASTLLKKLSYTSLHNVGFIFCGKLKNVGLAFPRDSCVYLAIAFKSVSVSICALCSCVGREGVAMNKVVGPSSFS